MGIEIRRAENKDTQGVLKLLKEVNKIHADGRPDIFKAGHVKYTAEDLAKMFCDDERPIFVYDDDGDIKGYIFCAYEYQEETFNLYPHKSMYIDDLCVDENCRGQHVGKQLYNHALQAAREHGCDKVTLHVWELNPQARGFYERLGMTPLFTTMEQIL